MYTSFTDWKSGLYLEHYGIPGMKWGVRRYQNKDGSYTEVGKRRAYALQTHKNVESIFSSFSKEDKRLLGSGEDDIEYMSREATAYWVEKRFLAKHGNISVGWLDIIRSPNTGEANIAIGVHSGYRGKGYASKLARKGAKWIDAHMDEFSKVNWGAYKKNAASIQLAKKNGFVLDEERKDFAVYSKRRKAAKGGKVG